MRSVLGVSLLFCLVSISRADEAAEVRAILAKAVKAHGGADKLAAVKAETWKTKGTTQSQGGQVYEQTIEWFVEGAAKARQVKVTDVAGKPQTIIRFINGDEGFIKTIIGEQTLGYLVGAPWVAEEKEQNYSRWITSLQPFARQDKGFTLAALGEFTFDGKPVVGIRVSGKEHRDVKLFFDKKEGLLLMAEFPVKHVSTTGGGNEPEVKQEVFYSDYKDFEGIKKPRKVIVKFDGRLYTEGELTEYKRLDKLEDDLFRR